MGEAWPSMKELYLCHEGHHKEKRGAPASSLSVFADSFPNLVKLGLFIQPGRGPFPQPYSAPCSSPPIRAFRSHFEVLDAGSSSIPVEHVPAMAESLVALSLPNPFVVKFNPNMQDHSNSSFTGWRGVRDAYLTGIRIRNAISGRFSAENAELKANIALLEQYVPLELASQETFRQEYQPIISAIAKDAANADKGTAAGSAAGPGDQSSV
ncbi:hypothetical protein FS837_008735 [Tulasnella sp. UAMH 9824]|nr:hypothetical protein FS837_008735 [Tulasnella sp. UAMH 9824]